MQFPIAIEWDDEQHAIGIVFPDIPGAITAADTIEEAYALAAEVANIHLEELTAAGKPVPTPSLLSDLKQHQDYQGWSWDSIDIDISPYTDDADTISLTIPDK